MSRVGALILAGGRSSRFGEEKSLFVWSGKPFIDHVISAVRAGIAPRRLLLGLRDPEQHDALLRHLKHEAIAIVRDDKSIDGPIASLAAGLERASRDNLTWLFVCGCDMPLLSPLLIAGLYRHALASTHAAALLPETPTRVEPLCAFYHTRRLLPHLTTFTHQGGRSFTGLIKQLQTNGAADMINPAQLAQLDPEWRRALSNINRPRDLETFDQRSDD